VVMEQADYQKWLSGNDSNEPLSVTGEKKFQQLACHTCHKDKANGRGPSLVGIFGKQAQLQNGQIITVDEDYIRKSILNPGDDVIAGYKPVMPTFQGQISEVGLLQITAYIKSLANSGSK